MVIERIGSVERHGDYFHLQVAVNGVALSPLWLCAPEFNQYEQLGESGMWNRIAFVAITRDRMALQEMGERRSSHEMQQLGAALTELAQRRYANAGTQQARQEARA